MKHKARRIAALALVALAASVQAAPVERPNIIFILADDLGYGDLGCYGQKQIQTPRLDALAASGIRFTQAYAGSTVCAPSRCTLMTGLHTGHCRVRGNARVPLEPTDVTVAEVLKTAGYTTALIGKWGLGEEDSTGIPTRQGFDYFFGYLDQHHAHNYYPNFLYRNDEKVPLPGNKAEGGVCSECTTYSHDLFTQEALTFVEKNANKPFFLYLAYTIPHANNEKGRATGDGMEVPDYAPYADKDWPTPEKGRAAMITRLDGDVGKLLDELETLGIAEKTIVFFTSDNGPHAEGGTDPEFFDSNGPYQGYKRSLHDGGIRVPTMVSWQGQIKPGQTSDYIWAFWDFLPTAAQLAGLVPPPNIDGVSIVPALFGEPPDQSKRFFYWEFHEGGFFKAVRWRNWKATQDAPDAPIELFDVTTDLGEEKNVAAEHPDVVAQIERYLKSARTPNEHWPLKRFRKEKAAAKIEPRPNILFAIADDWSYPHASIYGDPVVKTPAFDSIARNGIVFTQTYCAAPSCTPSRNAILTGQAPHRLEEGADLWSQLQKKFAVYPTLLEEAGYVVGLSRKGWGPGNLEATGWTQNPAGPQFKTFADFLATVPDDKPFCFWFGSYDPHRPYEKDSGRASGMDPAAVLVPGFLPDHPVVRNDILDYYFEVERFDRDVGEMLEQLEAAGRADNTIVIMTSDNGMPFPRGKTNLYDAGTRMPLAIRWLAHTKPGRRCDEFVNLTDMAPTFLEAAGLPVPDDMTGRSLMPILLGQPHPPCEAAFLERERHAQVRRGNLSYPVRAIRTHRYLYLRNLRPNLWPAGDPDWWLSVGPSGDIDGSPTKDLLLEHFADRGIGYYTALAISKRPPEELYDLSADPYQLHNVAAEPRFAAVKAKLRADLEAWQIETADPRAHGETDYWDKVPYYGGPAKELR